MYREASVRTTQESQESMPDNGRPTKKRRRATSKSTAVARKARFSVRPTRQLGGSANRAIIPVMYDYDASLSADIEISMQWNNQGYSVNGGAMQSISNLDGIRSCFAMMRVHHVEVTVMPGANELSLNDQSLTTGVTNIPYFYDAVEFIDPPNEKTLAKIQRNPTVRCSSLSKTLKRTIYPRVQGTSDMVDLGKSDKNIFIQSTNTSNTTHWNGYVAAADMVNVGWTYGTVRFSFKVFYECIMSK